VPKKLEPTLNKIKELGDHLGRALTIARELLSGNEADLLSKNRAALLSGNEAALLSGNSANLLSGNAPHLLSGNAPNLLSGNAPKVLSENQTPIFSGNKISFFSNLKVEIHIENSGNGSGAPPSIKPVAPMLQPSTTYSPSTTFAPTPVPYVPSSAPTASKPASKEVEQPSGTIYFPPSIPSAKP
jgi:hypothetical protein